MGTNDLDQSSATMNYPEAARYLRLGERTVKRLVASGAIRHVPVGHRVLFRKADLDAFLDKEARGGSRRRA